MKYKAGVNYINSPVSKPESRRQKFLSNDNPLGELLEEKLCEYDILRNEAAPGKTYRRDEAEIMNFLWDFWLFQVSSFFLTFLLCTLLSISFLKLSKAFNFLI